jgi:chromosome partitioning protein
MIVIFANQKGGVGKSTHCTLFAHYLSDKGKEVHVYDMDFQKTLERMRATDLSINEEREADEHTFDNPLKFSVNYVPDEKILSVLQIAEKDKDAIHIFDAPGNLGRENVIKALAKADVIITPFQYENVVLDSTAIFTQVYKKFKFKAKLIFLPTNIDIRVKLASAQNVNLLLQIVGEVAPIVYQRKDFKNFSTIDISNSLKEFVQPTYDFIYKIISGL